MKLALIPPLNYLHYTEASDCQLMLPHLLKSPTYYATYFKLCRDIRQLVILDNGAAEGTLYDAELLINTARQFEVTEVVANDVLGDAEESKARSVKFLDKARELEYEGRIAVVAQGANRYEAFNLVRDLVEKYKQVTTVHIPRLLIRSGVQWTRLDLAAEIHSMFPYIDIHLLGASNLWPREISEAAWNYPFIRSMDTSMPFVYARHNIPVGSRIARPPHREGDQGYFTYKFDERQEALARQNVDTMLLWADGVV